MEATIKERSKRGNNKKKSRRGRPRLTSREDRSPAMRRRLIEAAVESILNVGYARTSISEVVKRAGVSKGAFVYSFDNKLELIRATISYLFEAGQEKTTYIDIKALKTVADVEDSLQLVADILLDKIGMALFEVWMASRTDPELRDVFVALEAENRSARRRMLEAAVGKKLLETTDLPMLLEGAMLVLRGLSLSEVVEQGQMQGELWLWWRSRLAQDIFTRISQLQD